MVLLQSMMFSTEAMVVAGRGLPDDVMFAVSSFGIYLAKVPSSEMNELDVLVEVGWQSAESYTIDEGSDDELPLLTLTTIANAIPPAPSLTFELEFDMSSTKISDALNRAKGEYEREQADKKVLSKELQNNSFLCYTWDDPTGKLPHEVNLSPGEILLRGVKHYACPNDRNSYGCFCAIW